MLGSEQLQTEEPDVKPLSSLPFFLRSGRSSLASPSASLFYPEPALRSGFSLTQDDRPFPSGHPWGHCSRPASSMPHGVFFGAVRPAASSLILVGPSIGEISTACPFSDSDPANPIPPRTRSPLGLPAPPDQLNPICDREAHRPAQPDAFPLPGTDLHSAPTPDLRFQTAAPPPACCYSNHLEPSQLCPRSAVEVNQVRNTGIWRPAETVADGRL